MWSRAQLKGRAKATFKRNYWKCILISLLLTLIAGGSGSCFGQPQQCNRFLTWIGESGRQFL